MKQTKQLQRIYPGVTAEQKKLIKSQAKLLKMGHGEFIRYVLDQYFKNTKLK